MGGDRVVNADLRVLMILDHAPDYREAFFRELGTLVALTVVAQPCATDDLTPPATRSGYDYLELPVRRWSGFVWQPGLLELIRNGRWDIVCAGINLRQLSRLLAFVKLPDLRSCWVWRGHVFGQSQSKILDLTRACLLSRVPACLVYSDGIAAEVRQRYGIEAVSFNNTEVRAGEFRVGKFSRPADTGELRLLFVGRNQARKKLERLINLAGRRNDIRVRLVGPGMETLRLPEELLHSGRVEIYGKTSDDALNPHFDWADLVANPGHVGLLVLNAARHGKPIVIDADSPHAPEYWLAKESGQPFVAFTDARQLDRFLDDALANRASLEAWGARLQQVAKSSYTIEHMAAVHAQVFKAVATKYAHA